MMKRLNIWLGERKYVIETVGIVAGVGALIFAAYSTVLTRKALELSQLQFIRQQIPLWTFTIDSQQKNIQMSTQTPEVHLDQASIYLGITQLNVESIAYEPLTKSKASRKSFVFNNDLFDGVSTA